MSEESAASIKVNPEDRTARENLEASKSHALQAAEELRTAATQKAKEISEVALDHGSRLKTSATEKVREFQDQAAEKAGQIRDFAGERWKDAKHEFAEIKTDSERYVRENPGKSVLIALGIGFILGRILR